MQVLPRGRRPGVLRRRYPLFDRRTDARAASRVAGRRIHADIVYERYTLFGDAGRRVKARRPGTAWILEVNAPRTWEAALFEGLPVGRSAVAEETRTLRAADRVVVVSEALRRWVEGRGVDPARIRTVANGAEPSGRPLRPASDEFRVGYAGTFKPWHGLLSSLDALARLAASVGPRRLVLELHGDGPERGPFLRGLEAFPAIRVDDRGWTDGPGLAEARSRWSAAWVPSPRTPDPGGLAARFGEPVPASWFDPLKGAEARADGVAVWRGDDRPPDVGPKPPDWASVVAAATADLPQWDEPSSLGV